MFGKPGRPPADRSRRRREIWAAVGPLIEKRGARNVTMRQAAAAAFVSIGSLYQYFPTKRTLLSFGLDHNVLLADCMEFFARYGRLKERDPGVAMEAFSRFLGGQVFFIRPAFLAALESGGAGNFMSQLEAILDNGDRHIEELVLALHYAEDRDPRSIARSVRRVVLAGLLDRSTTRGELEAELRAALGGISATRSAATAAG